MDDAKLNELQALADAAPAMRAPVLLDEIADASYVPTGVGDLLLRGSPDPEEPAEEEVHALMRFIAAARTAVPELVAEVRRLSEEVAGLEALLSGCFLPLSLRELRRTKGTKEAGRKWYEQCQAFLAELQGRADKARREERKRCLAELKRLHAANERILPTGDLDSTPIFEGQKYALEQAIEAIEDMEG
jgi:hypothetical protein